MNFPKVSIITPSYNQGQYLEQTINSVLCQNYPCLEYIIIDGGSNDNSVEIINTYKAKLTYCESKTDRGQSHALNKGLAKCSGEIFNWLCSDDYLEKDAFITISELFKNNSVRIVSGKFRLFNDINSEENILDGISLDISPEKSFARAAMTQPATFWRTEEIRLFGGINENLHYFMDLELLLKYMLHYGLQGIVKTDKIIAHYRIHPFSKTAKEMDNTKIKQDSAFNIEKNNMFYFLSKHYGLNKKIQQTIKLLMNQVDENYTMTNIPETPVIDINRAINYYLYDFLCRHYYEGNYKLSEIIIRNIEYNILDKIDIKGFKYLRRKLFLKRFFKK